MPELSTAELTPEVTLDTPELIPEVTELIPEVTLDTPELTPELTPEVTSELTSDRLLDDEIYSNFGVVLPGELFPMHPSQIYEAMTEGILIFIVNMVLISKTNILKYNGRLLSVFLVLYSIFRFINEFFRQPDWSLQILGIDFSAGQIFSLPMFFTGIAIFFYVKISKS